MLRCYGFINAPNEMRQMKETLSKIIPFIMFFNVYIEAAGEKT